ncbi:MAG: hypothetical protein H6741_06205 [Alphaproteobacteria bacterium]|nr:hypothetical protein [Alphaproteobacteria bacterium]MCB9792302.1 hypothetical protein [Alphaproteobacteria bacterium]
MIPPQRFTVTVLYYDGNEVHARFANGVELAVPRDEVWGPVSRRTKQLALVVGEPMEIRIDGWWWLRNLDALPLPTDVDEHDVDYFRGWLRMWTER